MNSVPSLLRRALKEWPSDRASEEAERAPTDRARNDDVPPEQVRHIALLTWGFEREISGLARAAQRVAEGLLSHGCSVTVITYDSAAAELRFDGRLAVIGARAWETDADRVLRQRAGIGHLVAPRVFQRCLRDIAAGRPFDIIEATNWFGPSFFAPLLKTPIVIRHSTPATNDFASTLTLRDRMDRLAASAIEKRAARQADGWIFNADHQREAAEHSLRRNTAPVHDVLPIPLGERMIERGARAIYPDDDHARILFIGRAETRKGFRDALAAFTALTEMRRPSRRNRNLRLHLVGLAPGDLSAAIRELGLPPAAASMITDHGQLNDERLYDLLDRSHLVLAPSRYESYGLVYREAAAFGRPVVAVADDPSACEFARQSGALHLAGDREPETLAAAIGELLDHRERRLAMGRAGKLFTRRLSVETFGKKTLQTYQRTVARFRATAG